MKDFFQLLIPTVSELFCMFLAFFIPFVLYRISGKLYEVGNPSWKHKEENE
ncbi:hypothetical protein KDJ21_019415 [Metabacillus litoralis]|uniref:hypothetical protein n=1 Tax=Metabacillus TaxID=2675233 RepID=UPI0013CE6644|nr:hypothetical protein [Metabacillus litoralis]MCM3161603.1 hypothetical protein [Metabacillus litoralis]MCM3409433.1 hypothetical protein [Metabacillus litoralis]UHA58971.1 hypothetical protein KDJ21_019415 [Metabacillus litoralis]